MARGLPAGADGRAARRGAGGGAVTVRWSEAALALFELSAPTAVSAGAGSGKTTALVELCVRLLSGEALGTPCDPGELAAITFTERAGAELVERLRAAVAARAAARPPESAHPERGAAAGGPESRDAWHERLAGLDRMAVGTIHGFCGRLLREHAPEAGLDPDFAVLDEERTAAWIAAAARAAVMAALDRGDLEVRALAARDGVGALAASIVALVRARATRGEQGAPEPAVAEPAPALAAREAALAAGAALAGAGVGVSAAVQAALAALGPEDRAGPLEGATLARVEGLKLASKGGRLSGDGKAARDALGAAVDAWLRGAADARGLPQRRALAALVADGEARYGARKAAARAVDFDDLLRLARDLLRRDPALRAELRGRYRALLVDEYQDVNAVQQQLFDLLGGLGAPRPAGQSPSGPHPGSIAPAGPIMVAVGDAKQSIYRFRGADLGVFTRLLRRFEAGEGRVLHQSENHRSAPAVVDLVNAVFERTMRAPAGEAPRDDELAFAPSDRLVPRRPEGARPACELLVDAEGGKAAELRAREAEAIARRVRALVSGAGGALVRERGADGVERARAPRPSDVALLFRRLTEVDVYERALRAAGIPFRVARGQGFYQAPEVRDLGELLAALLDPEDAAAWAALLRSPLCAVTDGTLFLLARGGLGRLGREGAAAVRARVEEEAGPGAVPDDEWDRLGALLDTLAALRPLRDRLPVHELLARAVEVLELDAALLASPGGERRLANVHKALALAHRFHDDGGGALELSRHLRTMAERPPREPEGDLEAGDAVALLSIHQAKGLEWPVVFVPDLGARPIQDRPRPLLDAEGRLCAPLVDPLADAVRTTASLEAARAADRRSAAAESRRLLYVAMTRARDHLILSGEATKGSGQETWRAILEGALADVAEHETLVRRVATGQMELGGAAPEPAPAPAPDPAPGPDPAHAPDPDPDPDPGPAPVPVPPALRIAVTSLSDAFRCPRRHHFAHVLGLAEPRGVSGMQPGDDPGRATVRGTLAHAMLSEADLAAPPLERRAQLAAVAARRGHDPEARGVKRILVEVARFLDSAAGKELAKAARAGRLRREVPFLLRLDGEPGSKAGALYLDGAIDALLAREKGEVFVIDYKYALPRPGAAERYRFQLAAYALAAARAHPGAKVRAAIVFLRGDHRVVELTPSAAELRAFERDAPRLARLALGGEVPTAGALGRSVETCRSEGCGFVPRCHPVSG
ncbi:MAG: UvrD-helicase domain-containing protein [Anaeromyxobacteraceae bacterium]